MKKIMFNDKYGLTRAVLEGRKTMTRRIATYDEVFAPAEYLNQWKDGPRFGHTILVDGCVGVATSQYKEGDIVAVAQSYNEFRWPAPQRSDFQEILNSAGWKNKMYVKAELMPYRIRITKVSTQRLQDISEDDCLREGIIRKWIPAGPLYYYYVPGVEVKSKYDIYPTAREAFAVLIDKVSGKGTWAANPWVFVYSFELVV